MRVSWRFGRAGVLSAEAERVLCLLAAGGTLKAHRDLDGGKAVRLHSLNGRSIDVSTDAMDQLKQRSLIDSNMKFPAAAYLLTQEGKHLAAEIAECNVQSVGPIRF